METPCDVVRASTALVALNSQHVVSINLAAIKTFVAEYLTPEIIAELKGKYAERLASPLLFDSLAHEVNFAAVNAMLAFGSGHRAELHRLCNSGAAQTMLYGMIGLHMTYGDLNAGVLSSLSVQEVSSLFQIPLNEEYEVQPGIHGFRATSLKPLVELIHSTLTGAGARLTALGHDDFASYLKATSLKTAEFTDEGETRYSCQKVIGALVKDFPQFADDADVTLVPPPPASASASAAPAPEPASADPEAAAAAAVAEVNAVVGAVTYRARVTLLNKAQLLMADLYTRCGCPAPLPRNNTDNGDINGGNINNGDGSGDGAGPGGQGFCIREPCFAWSDTNSLGVFVDNVIPAMLSELGVLTLAPRLAAAVAQGRALRKGQAALLRAAAVAACEIALDLVNKDSATAAASAASAAAAAAPAEAGEAAAAASAEPAAGGEKVEDVLAAIVAASAADVIAEIKVVKADNETGEESPLSPTTDAAAFPRVPAPVPAPAAARARVRTVLSGPELDFLLYTRGKETPELRKVPRHVQVDTAAY